MQEMDITAVFERMNELKVVVLGDIMMDSYWWGDIERISPEAPVPVVNIHNKEYRLGGAANVALNCKALGAQVTLAGIVGNDAEGIKVRSLLDESQIQTDLVMTSAKRPTTNKIRILGRNQQVIRIDDEATHFLDSSEEHPFIEQILKYIQLMKPDVLIFEDYNKGLLTANLIERTIAHCQLTGTITAVDPKKLNFFAYTGVDIFKPNLKEVREGLNLIVSPDDPESLEHTHIRLKEILGHRITFITLSEKGVYVHDEQSQLQIPSHLRNIADVSGAGDTVIATAALWYTITRDPASMAEISNIAGGLVCEQVGVVPVRKELLLEECLRIMQ